MTQHFCEVLEHIKPAVVGIGLLVNPVDPYSVVVQGTGFVIDPSGWIMTNKHVAQLLIHQGDGRVGVRNAIARAVFSWSGLSRRLLRDTRLTASMVR